MAIDAPESCCLLLATRFLIFELRLLVAELLDSTRGALRKAISDFVRVQSAELRVALMERAQLLQIILIATEDSVATAIDKLVRANDIRVPLGDVRDPS